MTFDRRDLPHDLLLRLYRELLWTRRRLVGWQQRKLLKDMILK